MSREVSMRPNLCLCLCLWVWVLLGCPSDVTAWSGPVWRCSATVGSSYRTRNRCLILRKPSLLASGASVSRSARAASASAASAASAVAVSTLKLPLLQVYVLGQLQSELFVGDTVAAMNSVVANLLQEYSGNGNSDNNRDVRNVYTDEMLQDSFADSIDQPMVLLVHRIGCEKCVAALEKFYEYPRRTERVSFLLAEVEHVPRFVAAIQERLSGASATTASCKACNGQGIVVCRDCAGTGFVMKGTLASFCTSCGGKKVIRCSTCGGKCVNC